MDSDIQTSKLVLTYTLGLNNKAKNGGYISLKSFSLEINNYHFYKIKLLLPSSRTGESYDKYRLLLGFHVCFMFFVMFFCKLN